MPASAEQRALAAARRERIALAFAGGASVAELASREGIHRRTVREHLKARGVIFTIGRPRLHPVPEPRLCPICKSWYTPEASNVARGWGETHGLNCRMRLRWAIGNGISDVMLENAGTAAGKNLKAAFKSRWSPDSHRPKTIDDETTARVQRLGAKGYSYRKMAEMTGISTTSVHRILSPPTANEDDEPLGDFGPGRSILVARVHRLRAKGYAYQRIALETGISPSSARRLLFQNPL